MFFRLEIEEAKTDKLFRESVLTSSTNKFDFPTVFFFFCILCMYRTRIYLDSIKYQCVSTSFETKHLSEWLFKREEKNSPNALTYFIICCSNNGGEKWELLDCFYELRGTVAMMTAMVTLAAMAYSLISMKLTGYENMNNSFNGHESNQIVSVLKNFNE